MILLSAAFLLIGLFSELLFTQLLISNFIVQASLTHFISSLLIVFSYQLFLNRCIKKVDWSFYLFLLLLCFFTPILGDIVSFFIVFFIDKLHKKSHQYAEILDHPINLDEIIPLYTQYGAGGATMHVLKKGASTIERTKAFFALSQTQLSSINNLFYKLLPDTSDEMRLLAFGILDGQEDTITNRINKLYSMLERKNLSYEAYAKLEKDLALQYWELIYSHLIAPELEESILEKALSYALSAVKVLNEDASIWILLGKIYKHSKHYSQAEHAFTKAISFKISPTQVLPYLAEIKFITRDYTAMHNYLSKSETLLDVEQIAPVKHFWDRT